MKFGTLFKFYKNFTIRKKILFVLYVQIIIPLVFVGFTSYTISANIIHKKSIEYSQDILKSIEFRLNDYVSNLTILSRDLLREQKVYDALKYSTQEFDHLKNYEKGNAIKNVLKKVTGSRKEIQSACIVSSKGYYYEHDKYDNINNQKSIKDLIKYSEMLERARSGKGDVVWYLDSANGKVENVFLLRTFNDWDTFKEIGLIVILVKKKYFEEVFKELNTRDLKNIVVLSNNGDQIINMNPQSLNLANLVLDKHNDTHKNGYYEDKVANVLVSYRFMSKPDWCVVTNITLPELYKDVRFLGKWTTILSVITVVILFILSVWISFDLTRPIYKIVNAMKKVQSGETYEGIEQDRKDELGFLGNTFVEMTNEIDYLVKGIYQEQITRKEAQIKALQAQINPHFLFNTLESINWMAQLNNVPEISETVTALASLMQASIGRDDKLITLEEEVNYIDNYTLILKKRFEDRIELRKNLQPEALKVRIPKLFIQPLIENAVYHGVEKISGNGVIHLNAYTENAMLVIEVLDNGAGIEPEDLKMINEGLATNSDTYFRSLGDKRNKSIGIENVNRRIKLFYGEKYGLTIESEAGKFTKVVVSIPLKLE